MLPLHDGPRGKLGHSESPYKESGHTGSVEVPNRENSSDSQLFLHPFRLGLGLGGEIENEFFEDKAFAGWIRP